MAFLILKFILSAFILVLVTELAKHSGRMAAFILALPLMSILTFVWLYLEKTPVDAIARFSINTFLYVIPTLPLFVVFPILLRYLPFWMALFLSILTVILSFIVFGLILNRFKIFLW